MPIKLTVKRTRGNPLNAASLRNKLEVAQMQYAEQVAVWYLDTMETFSRDHGVPDAYPVVARKERTKTLVNVYVRGGWREIYSYLDFGAMRYVRLTGKHDSGGGYVPKTTPGRISPGPGAGGLWLSKSGRYALLPKPVPLEARRFTESIVRLSKSRDMSYAYFMRIAFRRYLRREWRNI